MYLNLVENVTLQMYAFKMSIFIIYSSLLMYSNKK